MLSHYIFFFYNLQKKYIKSKTFYINKKIIAKRKKIGLYWILVFYRLLLIIFIKKFYSLILILENIF